MEVSNRQDQLCRLRLAEFNDVRWGKGAHRDLAEHISFFFDHLEISSSDHGRSVIRVVFFRFIEPYSQRTFVADGRSQHFRIPAEAGPNLDDVHVGFEAEKLKSLRGVAGLIARLVLVGSMIPFEDLAQPFGDFSVRISLLDRFGSVGLGCLVLSTRLFGCLLRRVIVGGRAGTGASAEGY